MALMGMVKAINGGGESLTEYKCKINLQNSYGDEAGIIPTLGFTKMDISNTQTSTSSVYVKLCNVTDWDTYVYTDKTAIKNTLEAGQSASAIDLTGYNAIDLGTNGRSTGPTCVIKLYD